MVTASMMVVVFLGLLQAIQVLLMEGPEGLKQVPENIIRLLKGLRVSLIHMLRILQRLYLEILREAASSNSSSGKEMVSRGGVVLEGEEGMEVLEG